MTTVEIGLGALVVAALTVVNATLVVANLSTLATVTKMYTEILKIGHIKNIGKDV